MGDRVIIGQGQDPGYGGNPTLTIAKISDLHDLDNLPITVIRYTGIKND